MTFLRTILVCALLLATVYPQTGLAITSATDSLIKHLETARPDTNRLITLVTLSKKFRKNAPEEAVVYANRAIDLANWLLTKKSYEADRVRQYLADAYNHKGIAHRYLGDYDQAEKDFLESLEIRQQISYLEGIMYSYRNLANIKYYKGLPDDAIELNKKALKIGYELQDTNEIAAIENNIGNIYMEKGDDHANALHYFFKSLKTRESQRLKHPENKELKQQLIYNFTNLGKVCEIRKHYNDALRYHQKALELSIETKDALGEGQSKINIGLIWETIAVSTNKSATVPRDSLLTAANQYYKQAAGLFNDIGYQQGLAIAYSNLFRNYKYQDRIDTAFQCLEKALVIFEHIGDKASIAKTNINLGVEYIDRKNAGKALSYSKKGLEMARGLGSKLLLKDAYNTLSQAYKLSGNYQKALESYEEYSAILINIYNDDQAKKLGILEGRHESEMIQMQKEFEEKEADRMAEEALSRKNNLRNSAVLISIILLIIVIFISGRFILSTMVTEAAVFFIMILFFEFIMVLLDPSIDNYSAANPIIKLAFNATIAILLFPAHSFLEERIKKNMKKKMNLKDAVRIEKFSYQRKGKWQASE